MLDNESKSTTSDQTTSELKMETDKKNSHSEIEKRRRDKMNQYINDLSTMIPLPASVGKKPDKLTVLKFAVQHMKALQGSTEPLKETKHKPCFMSDDDLRNLISEATGGFIIVVECDRGQVLYVTDSVEEILNISQDDMVGFDFYELVHSKDVSMVKSQLYTTSSDIKEEKLNVKKSSMLKGEIDNSDNICPGAKRSFLCRVKTGATADDVKNIATKTSSRKTKPNVFLDEKDPLLISFEGYLKSWPPKTDVRSSTDPDSRSCLVAVGRVFEIDDEETDYTKIGQIREFETRQRADATFVRVDQSFTKIFGYLSDEVIGTSAYCFFHKDDLKIVAEAHHKAINNKCISRHDHYICRFRAKAGHYVPVKTTAVVFRNPWTKDVDYIITRSVVVSPMSFSAMQRDSENKTSPKQHDEKDENLRNLLLKLENLDSNQTKSQRKRGLNISNKDGESPKINSPSDIGNLIAEEAKKMGQQLRSSSQSAKYSNVEKPKDVAKTASNNSTLSPRGSPAVEQYRQNHEVEVTNDINSPSEEQNALADGILIEQLEGIRGAIDAMENTGDNNDDDSLSLIMNVIENEDLSSVLGDMPWNFM